MIEIGLYSYEQECNILQPLYILLDFDKKMQRSENFISDCFNLSKVCFQSKNHSFSGVAEWSLATLAFRSEYLIKQ